LAHSLNSNDPATAAASAALLDQLERVPPPPLHIRTLGDFEVRQLGRTIPARTWRRRRSGELLRLLLLSPNGSLLAEQITETFWPEKSPASGQALFHRATSELRRALEPDLPDRFPSRYLTVEQGRITLHLPTDSWVDFHEMARHLAQQEWAAALDLYQGDLFPDDRYADWAAARREQFRQGAVHAAVALARQQLALGQADKALESCCRALALEPWQEEAVLLGMRACVARSDRAGAIRLYLELERRLHDDLGIDPQPEVQELYRSL
jgi:DNA-binding SARP family transcriptional activator